MKTLRANGLEIGRNLPRVVGTLSTRAGLERLAGGKDACDIVEVRLDQIGIFPGWIDACRKIESAGTPVLLTLRMTSEGGKCASGDSERLAIFRQALTCASIIDVELRSRLAAKIRPEVERAGKILLVSYHDFSGTPPATALEAIIEEAAREASLVKIATMVTGDADLGALEAVLAKPREPLLCLIGMGDRGRETRTSFPRCGSCLTYGFIDSVCAPGQFSAADLVKHLRGAPLHAA